MGAAGSINLTSAVTADQVQQIVDCLATLPPDLLSIVSTAIHNNPNAISNLNKMGFIQEAEHVQPNYHLNYAILASLKKKKPLRLLSMIQRLWQHNKQCNQTQTIQMF